MFFTAEPQREFLSFRFLLSPLHQQRVKGQKAKNNNPQGMITFMGRLIHYELPVFHT